MRESTEYGESSNAQEFRAKPRLEKARAGETKGVIKTGRRQPTQLSMRLDDLAKSAPGLAREVAAVLYGAARVSFDLHQLALPCAFSWEDVTSDLRYTSNVDWLAPDEPLRHSFQPNERIEKSAECIALAAFRARDKLTVLG